MIIQQGVVGAVDKKKKKGIVGAVPGVSAAPTQTAPIGANAPSAPKPAPPPVAVPPPPPQGTPGQMGTEVKRTEEEKAADLDGPGVEAISKGSVFEGSDSTGGNPFSDKAQGIRDRMKGGKPTMSDVDVESVLAGVEEDRGQKQRDKAEQAVASDFNKAVADLLLGRVNTARDGARTQEEEDLIRQTQMDALNAQLRGSRARAGRSGFASGGAQQALEGDLTRQAQQAILADQLGLRRTEDQRAIDNALKSIGSDIDMRKQKEDEFFNRTLLDTIQSALGIEGGDEGAPGGGGGSGDIVGDLLGGIGIGDETELAASNSQIPDGEPGTMKKPKKVDKAPEGAVRGLPFEDGTYMYTLRHDDNGGWTEYFRAP